MKEWQLARGIQVPHLEGIHECYEMNTQNTFTAFTVNISAENIETVLRAFIDQLEEPCFFLLEVPTNAAAEKELRQKDTDPFHCDVYYQDGCSRQQLHQFLDNWGALLIHDGISCFGFASHTSRDEIYLGKYKVTTIFTPDSSRYQTFLAGLGIPQEEKIKTVWQNFTRQAPGQADRIEVDGQTVYEMVEELKQSGLYLAERRNQ